MKTILYIIFAVGFSIYSYSQEVKTTEIDSLYKEDQFYAGITYNILGNKPPKLSQTGFSMGFHFGVIKDMPINKNRNLAFGLGLGYSGNSFNQNLQIVKSQSNYNYTLLEDADLYTKNRFSVHLIEMPFEFRWRSSTPENYEFWRIYTGFKVGYVFANTAKYKDALVSQTLNGISDFNEINYGLTLCIGYNTWNFYAYYALNPIFSKSVLVDNKAIEMNAIKIGLMFYVL